MTYGRVKGSQGDWQERLRSFPKVQRLEETPVGRFIVTLEVFEQFTTLADHLQQAVSGMKIFLVRSKMRRQVIDALGQQGDLHLRGPGVALMETHGVNR